MNHEKGHYLRQDFRNLCAEIEEGRRRNWYGSEEPNEEQVRFWRRKTLETMLEEEEKSASSHCFF